METSLVYTTKILKTLKNLNETLIGESLEPHFVSKKRQDFLQLRLQFLDCDNIFKLSLKSHQI